MVLLAAAALVSCRPGASKKTITMWSITNGGNKRWSDEVAKGFMARHPDVDVRVINQTERNIITLGAGALERNEIDITFWWANPVQVANMAQAGVLLNMTPYFGKYGWDKILPRDITDFYAVKGENYIINFDKVYYFLFYYNQDIFAKLNLEPPKTEEELFAVCDAVRAAGYEPVSANCVGREMMGNALAAAMMTPEQAKAFTLVEPGPDRTLKFDDPIFVELFATLAKWRDRKVFIDSALSIGYPQMLKKFYEGSAAMLIDGSWSLSSDNIPGNVGGNFKWSWFPPPAIKPGVKPRFVLYPGNTWAVSARTKHPELVAEFVNDHLSTEGSAMFANIGMLPLNTAAIASPAASEFSRRAQATLEEAGYEIIPATRMGKAFGDYGGIYNQMVTEVFKGGLTPEAAAQQLEAAAKKEDAAR